MKKEISRATAADFIVDRFKLKQWKDGEPKPEGRLSFYSQKEDGTYIFFFDKREVARSKVIEILQRYFSDKCLPAGDGCAIEGITILFTVVKIGNIQVIQNTK